jgi:hypothetical protein
MEVLVKRILHREPRRAAPPAIVAGLRKTLSERDVAVHIQSGLIWAEAAVGRGATFYFTPHEEKRPT